MTAADHTLDLVHSAGDPGAEVAVHGMRVPLSLLLVIRAFERPARADQRLPVDEVVRWEDDRLVRLEARLLHERHQLPAEFLELLG